MSKPIKKADDKKDAWANPKHEDFNVSFFKSGWMHRVLLLPLIRKPKWTKKEAKKSLGDHSSDHYF